MSLWRKIENLFSSSKHTQTIAIGDTTNSNVIQSGRDTIINNHFPQEIYDKLVSMESLMENRLPKLVETSDNSGSSSLNPEEINAKLMKKMLSDIRRLIDSGQITDADLVLTDIMSTQGFDNIDELYRSEFYFFKGLVHLNRGQIEGSLTCAQNIISTNNKNSYAYNLMFKIASETQDDGLFHKSLEGLTHCQVSEQEIFLKKVFYEITKGNFSNVVNELTELDEIKAQFKENADALYYLGLAYLQKNAYGEANRYIQASNELSPLMYKQYLVHLSEIIPIIQRLGVMYLLTEEEKEFLRDKVEDLLSLKSYFEEKNIQLQEEYWGYIFNVKLFVSPADIVTDIDILPEKLKKTDMIQLMLAESYSLLGTSESAESIYRDLYEKQKNPNLLVKVTTRLLEKQDYTGLLHFLQSVEFSEYDALGDVAGNYVFAYSQNHEYTKTLGFINSLLESFENAPMLYESAAIVAYQNDDLAYATIMMEKSISLIEINDEALRMYISKSCERLNLLDHAIKVLLPIESKSKKVLESILSLSLKFDDDPEKISLAESTIETLSSQGDSNIYILNAQAEIALKQGQPHLALKPLIKSFEINPTINTAHNIVSAKLSIKEREGLQQFVDFLVQSDNPKAKMLAALGYDFLGNWGMAQQVGYKSLQLLGGVFDEDIYLQHSMLYLMSRNRDKSESDVINFEKVKLDTVITLQASTGEIKNVCLESNPDFVSQDGIVFAGCEHYSSSSTLSVRLLGIDVNDNCMIDGIEYLIKEITNKYVFSFRFASSTYMVEKPDSQRLHGITVDEGDPVSPMIPMLEQDRIRNEFLFEQYNFENNIGLPLATLVHKNYLKYPNLINHLFQTKGQVFFAGDLKTMDNTKPIVLTLSSIVIINYLNQLDIITNNKDKFIIPISLLNQVKLLFDEATTEYSQVSGYMVMDKSGRPTYIPISENEKQATINYWRELFLLLQSISAEEVNYELQSDVRIQELTERFEIDSIFLANQNEGYLLSDDLFIRNLAMFYNESSQTVNTITILSDYLEAGELLDAILKLSQYQYHYVADTNILLRIIHDLFINKTTIYGPGTEIEKFKNLVRNLHTHPLILKNSLPILRDVIYSLLSHLLNHKTEELIGIIIREMKIALSQVDSGHQHLLMYLLLPARLNVIKQETVTRIFHSV